MAQTFNTSISFIQSTSRKDRRRGAGSISVSAISGGVGSVADSATQSWVRNNFVDKTTEQEISAPKIFSQGIKIGDVSLFKHPDGYVYLDETLVLKGGVVMYGNSSGVDVPSIFDSLPIDNHTIKRDGNGALYVDETALTISGGGGVADSVYWNNVIGKPSWIGSTKPSYKYSEIEERPDLSVYAKLSDIPSLNGYATQSWVEGKGYLLATTASSTYQPKITSSNKLAYSLISGTPDLSVFALKSEIPTKLSQLTDDVVSGKYLSLSGGTINGNITANNIVASSILGVNAVNGKYSFIVVPSDENTYIEASNIVGVSNKGNIIFSGLNAENLNSLKILSDSVTSNGNITAPKFIGNLTGNADSATKLATARTIWGQSFDGTGGVDGNLFIGNASLILKDSTGDNSAYFGLGQNTLGNDYNGASIVARGNRGIYFATNGSLRTLITPSGNVAIGGTTADAKLHVHGNGIFTDDLTVPSITVGDVTLRKVDNYLYLDSSLVLSGGVTMYGDDGTTVKPIWESIPFDRTTIDWVNGKWTVVGGVGSGGGISEEFLNVKLQGYQPLLSTTNKLPYSLISGTPDLSVYAKLSDIPSLNGYATQSWVEGKGYLLATTASSTYQPKITSSNKLAYSLISGTPDLSVFALKSEIPTKLSQLTDDVVSGKYLSLSGGTINGNITANNIVASSILGVNAVNGKYSFIVVPSDENTYIEASNIVGVSNKGNIIFSGLNAENLNSLKILSDSVTSNGNITAPKFIGNLTGVASGNLPITGGTVSITDIYGLSVYRTTEGGSYIHFYITQNGAKKDVGFLGVKDEDAPTYISSGGLNYPLLHSNNFRAYALPITGGTVNGSITANSFIGNLTGNADSATKLATARTIWGQSFDGTGGVDGNLFIGNASLILKDSTGDNSAYFGLGQNTLGNDYNGASIVARGNRGIYFATNGSLRTLITPSGNVAIGGTTADAKLHVHGTAKFTGDTTFSSKRIVIGTIPVSESADGTLYVDANVVFRGGVAMFGNTTTTINEE